MAGGVYAQFVKQQYDRALTFAQNVAAIKRKWALWKQSGRGNGSLDVAGDKAAVNQKIARRAARIRGRAAAPAAHPGAPAAPAQAPVAMPALSMSWPQLLPGSPQKPQQPQQKPPQPKPSKPAQPGPAAKPVWLPKPGTVPKGQQGPGKRKAPKRKGQRGGIQANRDFVTGAFIPPPRRPWGMPV